MAKVLEKPELLAPAGASNSGFSSTFAMGDGPGFVTAEVSRIR